MTRSSPIPGPGPAGDAVRLRRAAGRAAHAGPVRISVLGGSAPATVQLVEALAGGDADAAVGVLGGPGPVELVLHGRSQARLDAVAWAARARAAALNLRVRVAVETSRAAALDGATIVLNQIRPGGLAGRAFDESFPRAFGVPGEETLGPGGLACAIRAVPVLRPVWADAARYCPGALLINLTNPAGIVTQAARAEFGLPVISVCDAPLDLLARAAARLADGPPGEPGAAVPAGSAPSAQAELRARYLGMNHVGWYVPRSAAELPRLTGLIDGLDDELPLLHGALPGSYLRYYVQSDRMLAAQQGRPTRADELRGLAETSLGAFGRGELPSSWRRPAPWYSLAVVPLAAAWLSSHNPGDQSGRGWPPPREAPLILGLPNAGRVPWLPDDVIVEGPATVSGPGQVRALPVVELPDLPRGILAGHASFERLAATTLAAGSPSRADLVRMLLANPLVTTLDQARDISAAINAHPTAG